MVDEGFKSVPERAPAVLRCPACSSMVEMPAEICPRCRVNLRTAFIKGARKHHSRLVPVARGGFIMLAIAALAGVAAVWEPSEDPEPLDQVQAEVEPPPPPPYRMIKGAPPHFWRLAADHPIMLRPYIMAYEARAAVMKVNERFERRQRLLEELEDIMSGLEVQEDDGMYDIFVKVPPGQRERMLHELDKIYGGPPEP